MSGLARNLSGGTKRQRDTNISSARLRGQLGRKSNISEETRKEFEEALESGDLGRINQAEIRFQAAEEGTEPIFRSRQLLQKKRELRRDRPGRAQTLLTGSRSSSSPLGTSKTIIGA